MKSDSSTQVSVLAGRLRELEHFTGGLIATKQPEQPEPVGQAPMPVNPLALVPVPRRGRVFLRSGEGHGVFAELTLTAPERPSVH